MASPVRFSCVILALVSAAAPAWAQATAPDIVLAPPAVVDTHPAPATAPTTPPVAATAPVIPVAPSTAPAPATEAATVNQPFVATVTADDVYVRSGPNKNFYDIGKLGKNDLVYIVGSSGGWYQILPPNGSFCLISKKFVTLDPGGATGTVSGDDVRVRAGTAINPKEDSVVLTLARKGSKVKVVGNATNANGDEYYQISPPDRAYFFVSPQFIKAAPGTDYKIPNIKLPAGVTGPQATVNGVSLPPVATIDLPPMPGGAGGPVAVETQPGRGTNPPPATTSVATEPIPTPIPTPVPTVTYSQEATQKFNDLNTRYQDEMKKPLAQRNVDDLEKDYKALLAMENLAPSIKAVSERQVTSLEQMAVLQKLAKESAANDDTLAKQRAALQDQQAAAEKALAAYQASSGFVAQGVLQSSTIVQGKYALVNPTTGRTVAYVDPTSEIDLSKLLGQYIGVRGTMSEGDVKVIKVANATVMAAPK